MSILKQQFSNTVSKRLRIVSMLLVALVTLAGLGWFFNEYLYRSHASFPEIQVQLTPSKTTVQKGEDFFLTLRMDATSTTKKIENVELYLDFSSNVSYYSEYRIDNLPGYIQTPPSYFNNTLAESVSTAGNMKRLKLNVTSSSSSVPQQKLVLLTLKFKGVTDGTASFNIVKAATGTTSTITGVEGTSPIQFDIKPDIVSTSVDVGQVNKTTYLHQGFITENGQELWYRTCQIYKQDTGSQYAGDPIISPAPVCLKNAQGQIWSKVDLTALVKPPLPSGTTTFVEQYKGYSAYSFNDASGNLKVRQSFLNLTGTIQWYRNCSLNKATGEVTNCNTWKSIDLATLRSPSVSPIPTHTPLPTPMSAGPTAIPISATPPVVYGSVYVNGQPLACGSTNIAVGINGSDPQRMINCIENKAAYLFSNFASSPGYLNSYYRLSYYESLYPNATVTWTCTSQDRLTGAVLTDQCKVPSGPDPICLEDPNCPHDIVYLDVKTFRPNAQTRIDFKINTTPVAATLTPTPLPTVIVVDPFPTFTPTPAGPTEVVWVEDAVPTGGLAEGTAENWNWISANPAPFSGTSAHQSGLVTGLHQHYFSGTSQPLTVGVGDKLFTYVYLDPTNPPAEVMLQWNDGSWDHRAYWGVNQLGWGVDGTNSRRSMGALPATGQWVRLEVPASMVGLEGKTVNGAAFTLFNGKATWDYSGKASAGFTPPTPTKTPTPTAALGACNPSAPSTTPLSVSQSVTAANTTTDYRQMFARFRGKNTTDTTIDWIDSLYGSYQSTIYHQEAYTGQGNNLVITFEANGNGQVGVTYPAGRFTTTIDGNQRTVSLPSFSLPVDGSQISFYIAADGSSYYAHSSHQSVASSTNETTLAASINLTPAQAYTAAHRAAACSTGSALGASSRYLAQAAVQPPPPIVPLYSNISSFVFLMNNAMYLRESYTTADGKDQWQRTCLIRMTDDSSGNYAGSPIVANCQKTATGEVWTRNDLRRTIPSPPGPAGDQSFGEWSEFLFTNSQGQLQLRRSATDLNGFTQWNSNCLFGPAGGIGSCNSWKVLDLSNLRGVGNERYSAYGTFTFDIPTTSVTPSPTRPPTTTITPTPTKPPMTPTPTKVLTITPTKPPTTPTVTIKPPTPTVTLPGVCNQTTCPNGTCQGNVCRPSYCQSAIISSSSSTLSPGGKITLKSTAKTNTLKTFSFLFYNLENLNSDNTPKPVQYEEGKHYIKAVTPSSATNTASVEVPYEELFKPDKNNSGQIPKKFQVNAYFIDQQGRTSAAESACIMRFNLDQSIACTSASQCGPSSSCTSGYCQCQSGFSNCDGVWSNGCEKNGLCPAPQYSLNLKLRFQGVRQQPSSALNHMRVRVTVFDPATKKKEAHDGDFTAQANGIWEGKVNFYNAPAAKNIILVKGEKHLQKKICVSLPKENNPGTYSCGKDETIALGAKENTLDFSNIYLLAGDLPIDGGQQDGIIDSRDVIYLRSRLGSHSDLPVGDLNYEAIIDSQDTSIVTATLNLQKNEDEKAE